MQRVLNYILMTGYFNPFVWIRKPSDYRYIRFCGTELFSQKFNQISVCLPVLRWSLDFSVKFAGCVIKQLVYFAAGLNVYVQGHRSNIDYITQFDLIARQSPEAPIVGRTLQYTDFNIRVRQANLSNDSLIE